MWSQIFPENCFFLAQTSRETKSVMCADIVRVMSVNGFVCTRFKGQRAVTPTAVCSCVKTLEWISSRWGPESAARKKKPKQSLFKRGLNYANPIIVINCWENSALIAPKQWAQLYTALMWILGNQLVHFHMKELILCLEGEMEEVAVSFWQKPLRVFCTNLHKRLSSFNFTGSTTM